MDLVSIAQRLRAVYESIEDLICSDEKYEIERPHPDLILKEGLRIEDL